MGSRLSPSPGSTTFSSYSVTQEVGGCPLQLSQFPWRCPLTAKMPLLDQDWLRSHGWRHGCLGFCDGLSQYFLQDLTLDTCLLRVTDLHLFSFLMWGNKTFWQGFISHLHLCQLLRDVVMFSRSQYKNFSLSSRFDSVAEWICLNSYPHSANPGAMCLQILFLSLHCFALYHKETASTTTRTPVGRLPTDFSQWEVLAGQWDGREREVRVFLPFFLCLPTSSISTAAPHRPSLLPAPIR